MNQLKFARLPGNILFLSTLAGISFITMKIVKNQKALKERKLELELQLSTKILLKKGVKKLQ